MYAYELWVLKKDFEGMFSPWWQPDVTCRVKTNFELGNLINKQA